MRRVRLWWQARLRRAPLAAPAQVLAEGDKAAIKAIAAEFEIDFLSLSFARSSDDIKSTRKYIRSIGLSGTKVARS